MLTLDITIVHVQYQLFNVTVSEAFFVKFSDMCS